MACYELCERFPIPRSSPPAPGTPWAKWVPSTGRPAAPRGRPSSVLIASEPWRALDLAPFVALVTKAKKDGKRYDLPDAMKELGRPRGEVPAVQALFHVAPRRTPRASFEARGSPVIYAAVAVGCRLWMESWQEWQTTRVLRRFLIMTVAHVGWSAPGLSS